MGKNTNVEQQLGDAKSFFAVAAQVIRLRATETALHSGREGGDNVEHVFCFLRRSSSLATGSGGDGGEAPSSFVVVVNLGNESTVVDAASDNPIVSPLTAIVAVDTRDSKVGNTAVDARRIDLASLHLDAEQSVVVCLGSCDGGVPPSPSPPTPPDYTGSLNWLGWTSLVMLLLVVVGTASFFARRAHKRGKWRFVRREGVEGVPFSQLRGGS